MCLASCSRAAVSAQLPGHELKDVAVHVEKLLRSLLADSQALTQPLSGLWLR